MFCGQCGNTIQPGESVCSRCGTPVSASGASSPSNPANPPAPPSYDPTVLAPVNQSSPSNPANPPATPSYDPTILAPGNQPSPSNPANPPSQPAYNPTVLASSGTSSPYNNAAPSAPPPQAVPGQFMPNQPVPPPPSTPYSPSAPYQPLAPVPVVVGPQKRGGAGGWILSLVLGLVLVASLLCSVVMFASGTFLTKSSARSTANAVEDQATQDAQATQETVQLTPTPYPPYTESNSPSGSTFEGNAQQVILNAQTASEVDSKNEPTELQSIFNPGDKIYLAYEWAQGHAGYAYTIWYFNGEQVSDSKSDYIASNKYGYGYMSDSFDQEGQGAIEIYLCGKSSCSDRQLAWVRPFTIKR